MRTKRILIVDDNQDNVYLLRALLEEHGYEVIEASNGAQALEKAAQYPPDLIVSDILMPVMDGFALCRAWMKDARFQSVPFVFYTATYTDDRDRDFALELGAQEFIVKPAEPEEFTRRIKQSLKPTERAADPPPLQPADVTHEQEEIGYLKQYNEVLVHKLESKLISLERANRKLKQDIIERERAEAERARLEEQLIQAQKMESVGRLAGGVAHDFNNMLGVIFGYTELALDRLKPEDPLHADIKEIQRAAQRSADLTRQLLSFARKQTVAPEALDLNRVVSDVSRMLRRLIGEDIELICEFDPDVWPVKMDRGQMDHILTNLCVNARDAISGTGRIVIRTRNRAAHDVDAAAHGDRVPGDTVELSISDTGCGMTSEVLNQIFEPFFTTKPEETGTGLGLSSVYGAIHQNDGRISVKSKPGEGSTFSIYLPRYSHKPEQAKRASEFVVVEGSGETVLLVEDEPAIMRICKSVMEGFGYRVLAATSPSEALRKADQYPGSIDLLVTDVVMPEMNGRDLADNLLALYPRMKRLYMSGYATDLIARHNVLNEGAHFIQKPFSSKALGAKLREALGADDSR